MQRVRRFFAGIAFLVLLCAGCADEPPRIAVYGQVTLDGRPVKEGTISFRSRDGSVVSTGTIKDGEFQIPPERGPLEGENRIEIYGVQQASGEEPRRVPVGYNAQSNLVTDLQPNLNVLRLNLTTR